MFATDVSKILAQYCLFHAVFVDVTDFTVNVMAVPQELKAALAKWPFCLLFGLSHYNLSFVLMLTSIPRLIR